MRHPLEFWSNTLSLLDVAKGKARLGGNSERYLLITTFAPLGVERNTAQRFYSIEAARAYIAPKSGWGMYEIKDTRTGKSVELVEEGSPQHIKVLGLGFS